MNIGHMSPPRHAGARVGPRGSATWPCVPRRTHVGPVRKSSLFLSIFLIILNVLNRK